MEKECEFNGVQFVNRLCTATNKNQKQLADELHVSESTITNWKKKNIIPKTEQLLAIYETYGLSADFLLGLEHVKTTSAPTTAHHTFKELLREIMLYDVFTEEKPTHEYPVRIEWTRDISLFEDDIELYGAAIDVAVHFCLDKGKTIYPPNIESAIDQYNKMRPVLSMDALKDRAALLIDDVLNRLPYD